jgi:tRNA G18 (ribose-2'-O)-methylase SpoU
MNEKNKNVVLILNDIRSVYNVGAIFRTADGAGVSKIYLVGVTPSPIDRFGRKRKDVAKTALGAEETVPFECAEEILPVISKLRANGFKIVAVEQDEKSVDYKKIKFSPKMALIFGNEVGGLPKNVLEKCDKIAEIPMKGNKESLNVSVAVGIILFRVLGI